MRRSESCAARLGLSSRFQDQVSNSIWLRYEGNVTRLYLDRFRAHALGHEAFEIGVDRPIFRGHSVPARLRPPGRVGRLVRQQCPFALKKAKKLRNLGFG